MRMIGRWTGSDRPTGKINFASPELKQGNLYPPLMNIQTLFQMHRIQLLSFLSPQTYLQG